MSNYCIYPAQYLSGRRPRPAWMRGDYFNHSRFYVV